MCHFFILKKLYYIFETKNCSHATDRGRIYWQFGMSLVCLDQKWEDIDMWSIRVKKQKPTLVQFFSVAKGFLNLLKHNTEITIICKSKAKSLRPPAQVFVIMSHFSSHFILVSWHLILLLFSPQSINLGHHYYEASCT